MSLSPGVKLGPYEITGALGAGGMGEVYRARDTRLDRDVAIKVLPEQMARDAERVARFQREAKVLAALNHPNIAAIYGFETESRAADFSPRGRELVDNPTDQVAPRGLKPAAPLHFLVLEFVDGQTLAERLDAGPVPIDEALDVARQIAEALEAAHEQGIVHRDLKPSNVKISPEGKVKVLDFGLAKALGSDPSHTDTANSPTLTADFTRKGVVLGTAAYMSPEQARGKPIDKRTDIWSFGVVLYECLSGQSPFEGETSTDLIAKILEREPDWNALPSHTPVTVQLVLRRCLVKDRNRRLRDIGDARIEIEEAIRSPESDLGQLGRTPARRRATGWAVLPWAVVAALAVLAVAGFWPSKAPRIARPMHLALPLSPEDTLPTVSDSVFALSPDGDTLVYVASRGGASQLFLHPMSERKSTPLRGTEAAQHPFFSPDGQWVAFFAGNKLKKISVNGGPPETLCNTRSDRGGSWAPDHTIIFAPTEESGLYRVSVAGGEPEVLTTVDAKTHERSHRWPEVLPGGNAVLFTVEDDTDVTFDEADIVAVRLDTGSRKTLVRGGSYARYVPTGHLVYVKDGTLFAAPFDAGRLELTGPVVPVIEAVQTQFSGGAQFSFSQTGHLIYLSPIREQESTVVWIDRLGAAAPLIGRPQPFVAPRLSPDGRRLALGAEGDIWIYEIDRDVLTRLTFDGLSVVPVWSPDGRRIVYGSNAGGLTNGNLFVRDADGSSNAVRLTESDLGQGATCWSSDGKTLVYEQRDPETGTDIWLFDLQDGVGPRAFLQTPFEEGHARLSPDDRWLAYASNESGRGEVYVRPLSGAGREQVSTEGGIHPAWSRDGRELFYRSDGRMMVVEVTTAPAIRFSKPQRLFVMDSTAVSPYDVADYDVSADGKRFVALRTEPRDPLEFQPRVVLNWFEELKAKVPAEAK